VFGFHLLRFLPAGYRPTCLHVSPCSSPDSGPSCDILNLADVVDIFVSNSMPQIAILKSSIFTKVFFFFFFIFL